MVYVRVHVCKISQHGTRDFQSLVPEGPPIFGIDIMLVFSQYLSEDSTQLFDWKSVLELSLQPYY